MTLHDIDRTDGLHVDMSFKGSMQRLEFTFIICLLEPESLEEIDLEAQHASQQRNHHGLYGTTETVTEALREVCIYLN